VQWLTTLQLPADRYRLVASAFADTNGGQYGRPSSSSTLDFVATPEPSSAALLGVGLALLARRRSARRS
jgi:hypothetical protein